MSKSNNNKEDISNNSLIYFLDKFQIADLNPMQQESLKVIRSKKDVVLISPTGTGKTLAFLLPLIKHLDNKCDEIQMLIIVPSRELAQQIEQVARKMGSGFKVNAVYGGRSGSLDKIDLKHRPAILIGTPGRVADRLRRDHFSLEHVKTLVLDEYDKSLEIGFDKEMSEIINALPNIKQRILTSATSYAKIPEFVGLNKPVFINYIKENSSKLTFKTIISEEKDKLRTLEKSLTYIGNKPGIIFCNYKDALESDIADFNHLAKKAKYQAKSVTAALFLEHFAGNRRWVHLDIAGTGRSEADAGENPKGGTGYGVRLLTQWIMNLK